MSVFRINKSPGEERSDKGLRDKLNAHSVTPPSYIWDNVEENLPQKRKRRGFIFWLLPLAACLAGLAALLYIGSPKNTSPLAQHQQTNTLSSTKDESKSQVNKEQNSSTSINNHNKIQSANKQANEILSSEKSKHLVINERENTKAENLASTSKTVKSSKIKNNTQAFLGNHIYANSKSNKKQDQDKTNSSHLPEPEISMNLLNLKKDQPQQDTHANLQEPDFTVAKTEITNNKEQVINNSADTEIINSVTDSTSKNIAENKMQVKNPDKDITKPKYSNLQNRWSIGLESGLGYAYRFIPTEKNLMMEDVMVDTGPPVVYSNSNYSEVESAGISLKNGLNIQYHINNKWSLLSGISYTKASIRSKINAELTYRENTSIGSNELDSIYVQKNSTGEFSYGSLDGGSNFIPTSLNEKSSVTHQHNVRYFFSFIDIPLQVQYRSTATKPAWFVLGGPSAHFLVSKKAIYSLNSQNNSTQLEKSYNTFAVSADVFTGISVPLKKFDLQFGPAFNYWLTPLMPVSPKTHLYTTQLKGAIYYRF